jgi:hypothetical protein
MSRDKWRRKIVVGTDRQARQRIIYMRRRLTAPEAQPAAGESVIGMPLWDAVARIDRTFTTTRQGVVGSADRLDVEDAARDTNCRHD